MKKYGSIANVKASIMSWAGLMSPEQEAGIYNSSGYDIETGKKMNLPDTWVIQPYDKASKEETGVPIEIYDWYKSKLNA